MSLLSISLPSQAVGSSVPTDLVWPSRPCILASPRHYRVSPQLQARHPNTEGLSSTYSH